MPSPIIPFQLNTQHIFSYLQPERSCYIGYETEKDKAALNFSFIPFSHQSQKTLVSNLHDAFHQVSLLQKKNLKLQILLQDEVTLLPLTDFQEEHIFDFYNFAFPNKKNIEVFYDVISTFNIVVLFSVPKHIAYALRTHTTNLYFNSYLTPLLRHFHSKLDSKYSCQIFTYLISSIFTIVVIRNNELIFVNQFNTENRVENILYYLFSVMKESKFDNNSDALYLSGEIEDKENTLKPQLLRFVKNVFLLYPESEFYRHPLSLNKNIPYPLLVQLLNISH